MDQFQYTLKIQEIERLKTLKAKEAMIRYLFSNGPMNAYGINTNTTLDEVIPYYKCISKVLLCFRINRLPEFIRRGFLDTQKQLLNRLITTSASYEKIVSAFEFNDTVTLQGARINSVTKLAEIFQDKPLTFYIAYDYYTSRQYEYLLTIPLEGVIDISGYNTLLEIEHIKSTLPTGVRYTIIEDMLDRLYAANSVSIATSTEDELNHLAALGSIVAKRLREQSNG